MPKAIFVRDYDHRTTRGSIVAYQAGWSGNIPQAHLEAAERAGALAPDPAEKPREKGS